MWFPGLPLYFHCQAPTVLSVALVPYALTAVLDWYRDKSSVAAVVAVVTSAAGAGVAHPGAGQLLVVVGVVLALLWSAQLLRRPGARATCCRCCQRSWRSWSCGSCAPCLP